MKGQRGFVQVPPQAPAASWLRGLGNIARRLKRWRDLGQQRRMLAALDDGVLKDLGLSRADILMESERPFWDDPARR